MEEETTTPAYMQLAAIRFCLSLPELKNHHELRSKLMEGIREGNMAPYYKEVCEEFNWPLDNGLFKQMSDANTKRILELDQEHDKNFIDEEDQVSGIWQAKLDYLCSIGDQQGATTLAETKFNDKSVPKSHRIDAIFALFRIAYFHGCNIRLMKSVIEKAADLIETSGGDWSARNKLKAYEGIWSLAVRDFTRAANLFVDVVPTFESYELASFGTIIRYTVYACMIALPRSELKKKLMHHGVMAQALNSEFKDLKEYFLSLYEGRYSDFFICLAKVENDMKKDPLLYPHYRHYNQAMRLRAYKQILQAYRSLSLDYMAKSFGVTVDFIESEVARFAAAGRLQCKIDSVAGAVVTCHYTHSKSECQTEAPEATLVRGTLYQSTVKKGDILLNRLKKLARIIDF
ncbi:hypothetical protein V9T40_000996 [Parthenolecanium corni]|uniref:26S proteasome non-ATPase regulatory subunit 6 n=1 Tax=Parthenolecanium corni TaxID=536013 RepID=A0AAN9TAK8_9HEMI